MSKGIAGLIVDITHTSCQEASGAHNSDAPSKYCQIPLLRRIIRVLGQRTRCYPYDLVASLHLHISHALHIESNTIVDIVETRVRIVTTALDSKARTIPLFEDF
jgi:hypothetical protein